MSILDEVIDLSDMSGDRLKAMIHGDPGTGKTTLASSIAEKVPTLYVDLLGEQGAHSVPDAVKANIRLVRPRSVEQLNDLYWALQNGEVKLKSGKTVGAVVIESASALQQMFVRYVQGHDENAPRPMDRSSRGKKMDLRQVYGDVVDNMKDFMTFWYALADGTSMNPTHVIMTSQSRRREVRAKTENPNDLGELLDEYIGPDVSPGSANAVEAPPNFVLYTFIGEYSDPNDFQAEPQQRYAVRCGPHEMIRTKVHGDIIKAAKWPAVIGLEKKGQRLTLPKLCRFFDITL